MIEWYSVVHAQTSEDAHYTEQVMPQENRVQNEERKKAK
jgi:hypothetical protein